MIYRFWKNYNRNHKFFIEKTWSGTDQVPNHVLKKRYYILWIFRQNFSVLQLDIGKQRT